MSSHKTQQRNKQQQQRSEREKIKPSVQQSVQSRPAQASIAVAHASPRTLSPAPIVLPTSPAPPAPIVLPAMPAPVPVVLPPAVKSPMDKPPMAKPPLDEPHAAKSPVAEATTEPEGEPTPATPTPVPKPAKTNGDGHMTRHINQHTPTPLGELSEMFATMRALFVQDRSNGSRGDAARCGICYLTFAREQLVYRDEEGFYACPACLVALNDRALPMLRRQRK